MVRRTPLLDTPPRVVAEHARLMAGLSPGARAQRVRDLTDTASMMALAGLRGRYPRATEAELLLRLAVLRLGADVVERVYGWRAEDDGA